MRRFLCDLIGVRCSVCRERTRHMSAHLFVDHPGGV